MSAFNSIVSVLSATVVAIVILCSMGAWIDLSARWGSSTKLEADSRTAVWMKALNCNTNVSFCIESVDPSVPTTYLQPNFDETRMEFMVYPRYNSDDYKGIIALTFFVIIAMIILVWGTWGSEDSECCGTDECRRDYNANRRHIVRFPIWVAAFALATSLMIYPAMVCAKYPVVGVDRSVSMFVKNSDVAIESDRQSIEGMLCVPRSFGGYLCLGSVNDMYRLTPAFSAVLDRLTLDVNKICSTSADPRILVIIAAVTLCVWLLSNAFAALEVLYGCEKNDVKPRV